MANITASSWVREAAGYRATLRQAVAPLAPAARLFV